MGNTHCFGRNSSRTHRRVTYTNLLTSGKLNSHLAEIQQTAQRRMEQIVAQMAKNQGVTEELKASDQMKWVQMMTTCRMRRRNGAGGADYS